MNHLWLLIRFADTSENATIPITDVYAKSAKHIERRSKTILSIVPGVSELTDERNFVYVSAVCHVGSAVQRCAIIIINPVSVQIICVSKNTPIAPMSPCSHG